MKIAAVFFCYRELSETDLMAFNFSYKNLKNDFDLFCITTTKRQSYVETTLGFKKHRIFIRDKELKTLDSYTRFLKQLEFYNLFREYKSILVWQEDAVILRQLSSADQLDGFSFIGAPIIKYFDDSAVECVGNGGLSIRNIQDHIGALEKGIRLKKPHWFMRLPLKTRVGYYLEKFSTIFGFSVVNYNEDFYWSCLVDDEQYSVANLGVARSLFWEGDLGALSLEPSTLPFGCHAWEKFSNAANKTFISDLIGTCQSKK